MGVDSTGYVVLKRDVAMAHQCGHCQQPFLSLEVVVSEGRSRTSRYWDREKAAKEALEAARHWSESNLAWSRRLPMVRCPGCGLFPQPTLDHLESECRRGVPSIAWKAMGILVLLEFILNHPVKKWSDHLDAPFLIPLALLWIWILLRWTKSRDWKNRFRIRLEEIPQPETHLATREEIDRFPPEGYRILQEQIESNCGSTSPEQAT